MVWTHDRAEIIKPETPASQIDRQVKSVPKGGATAARSRPLKPEAGRASAPIDRLSPLSPSARSRSIELFFRLPAESSPSSVVVLLLAAPWFCQLMAMADPGVQKASPFCKAKNYSRSFGHIWSIFF